MEEAKELLLADAIETAIRAERKVIKLKLILIVLGIIILGLTGGLIWTATF